MRYIFWIQNLYSKRIRDTNFPVKFKSILIRSDQGSASGTETGTHFKILDWTGCKFKICGSWDWNRDWNLKNPRLGPGRIKKSGTSGTKGTAGICGIPQKIRDRDEKSENPGFGIGTETQNWKIRDPGLGPGLRFAGRGIPGLNFWELSRGLKIFRNTVPVPCRLHSVDSE